MLLTKAILRHILLYNFKLGNKAAEATRRVCSAFGENSVSEGIAQKWFCWFSSGDESLEDKPIAGCYFILNRVQLKEIIKQNPNQTCQKLAHWLGVHEEIIRLHLLNIGMTWKFSNFAPHALPEENEPQWLNICLSFLSYHKKISFLDQILRYDEKCVPHDNRKKTPHRSSFWFRPIFAKSDVHKKRKNNAVFLVDQRWYNLK